MFKPLIALLGLGGLLALLSVPLVVSAEKAAPAAGTKVRDFTLPDAAHGGQRVSLADLKGRAVVVAFVGTECPINNAYMARLAELHREFSGKGVAFVAVNANSQDTP